MACKTFNLPGNVSGIICGKFPRAKRCACGKPSTRLCDWKILPGDRSRRLKSVTCDVPLCDDCTHVPAPEKDLCQMHWNEWQKRTAPR